MGKLTMTRRTFAKMTAATTAAAGIAGTGTALAESVTRPSGAAKSGWSSRSALRKRPCRRLTPPRRRGDP